MEREDLGEERHNLRSRAAFHYLIISDGVNCRIYSRV